MFQGHTQKDLEIKIKDVCYAFVVQTRKAHTTTVATVTEREMILSL